MFDSAKYIIMTNCLKDEKIFTFDGTIKHSDMEKALKQLGFDKAISAGFIDEFMQCYGESQTLNLKSRDIDTLLLQSMLSIDDKSIQCVDPKYSMC